jgi:hypothetical protein
MAPLTIHVKKKEKRKQFLEKDFLTNATARASKTGNGNVQSSMTVGAAISVFSPWNPHKTCRVEQSC